MKMALVHFCSLEESKGVLCVRSSLEVAMLVSIGLSCERAMEKVRA